MTRYHRRAISSGYRQHYKGDGMAKIGYLTPERAEEVRKEMIRQEGDAFTMYRCPICGYYHVGHSRE